MDDETFKLCKEVYERTGDKGIQTVHTLQWIETKDDVYQDWSGKLADGSVPVYTSDYLLEKLPNTVEIKKRDSGDYSALIPSIVGALTLADTPLKALLKLTIALHESGQLSQYKEGE